jgi:hypothetical protein
MSPTTFLGYQRLYVQFLSVDRQLIALCHMPANRQVRLEWLPLLSLIMHSFYDMHEKLLFSRGF